MFMSVSACIICTCSRIQAVPRRTQTGGYSTKLKVGDLVMDISARKVIRGGRVIDLQPLDDPDKAREAFVCKALKNLMKS
ncbi:hypothetical protein LCGC14_3158330 [marine sediment metagenome]|uniref:Uncharacterized protein n=1 Tax=marine sediment metagenome TaxID=412755 RepID=A0A0F8YGH9_9ZZZZ